MVNGRLVFIKTYIKEIGQYDNENELKTKVVL